MYSQAVSDVPVRPTMPMCDVGGGSNRTVLAGFSNVTSYPTSPCSITFWCEAPVTSACRPRPIVNMQCWSAGESMPKLHNVAIATAKHKM
jgi:hypothetical protein